VYKSKNQYTVRHSIFLEKAFVEDNLFPFKAGDFLIIRIDSNRDRLIVTKDGAKIISIQQEDENQLDEIKEDNISAGKTIKI
jgi:hypothetical protein